VYLPVFVYFFGRTNINNDLIGLCATILGMKYTILVVLSPCNGRAVFGVTADLPNDYSSGRHTGDSTSIPGK